MQKAQNSEGNAQTDAATRLTFPIIVGSVQEAQNLHRLHHLNAQSLRLFCKISREQAREIVKKCPSCVTSQPVPHLGVNPRGLLPNQLWQMDVTHFPKFGKLKYLHVSIDTYSGFVFASPHTGEAAKDVIRTLSQLFLYWENLLRLRQTMVLLMSALSLNNFVRRSILTTLQEFPTIHRDRESLKEPIKH